MLPDLTRKPLRALAGIRFPEGSIRASEVGEYFTTEAKSSSPGC